MAAVGAISGLNNSYDSPFRGVKQRFYEKQVTQGSFGGERRINNIHGANMAIRRSAWEQVRYAVSTDPGIHEDVDLALCLREHDIEIAQLTDLFVDISPRRALTPPLAYTDYTRSLFRIYELHGRMSPEAARAMRVQWLAHCAAYAGYRLYDPARGRFTLSRLFSGGAGRAMPVSKTDSAADPALPADKARPADTSGESAKGSAPVTGEAGRDNDRFRDAPPASRGADSDQASGVKSRLPK